MTEIPIRDERGNAKLWVAIVVAAFALLVVFVWPDREDEQAVSAAENQVAETTGPVRDLALLADPARSESLSGRVVELTDVRVLSATGDKIFWVGNDMGQQALVVLEETPTGNLEMKDGRYVINPGQTLSITGEIVSSPSFGDAQGRWNLESANQSDYETQKVYIHARHVDVTGNSTP